MAAVCAVPCVARPGTAPCRASRLQASQPRRAAFVPAIATPATELRSQRVAAFQRRGAKPADDDDQYTPDERFQERVVQVRRVTKVVKGGKQLSFRAVVVVGDEAGSVGVGVGSSKEVVGAVQKAVTKAKKTLITVPLNENSSFPHRIDGIFGAAKVMLRPASEGTGVIAGGSVRVVLELAGVKNAFGKQLGTQNTMNNAKATIQGLQSMRTVEQVAELRGVPVETLYG